MRHRFRVSLESWHVMVTHQRAGIEPLLETRARTLQTPTESVTAVPSHVPRHVTGAWDRSDWLVTRGIHDLRVTTTMTVRCKHETLVAMYLTTEQTASSERGWARDMNSQDRHETLCISRTLREVIKVIRCSCQGWSTMAKYFAFYMIL